MSSSKDDRKTTDKHRTCQMRSLCSQLHSLVPHQASSSGEPMKLLDQIDEATDYIKELRKNVDELQHKRDNLRDSNDRTHGKIQVEVSENGGILEVTLITGLEFHSVFNEVIQILDEENVEVFNANYSVVEDIVYHGIQAHIREDTPSNNVTARVSERLKKFTL